MGIGRECINPVKWRASEDISVSFRFSDYSMSIRTFIQDIAEKDRWKAAQRRERNFYSRRSEAIDREEYFRLHRAYWRRMLAELPELKFSDDGLCIDVGCGPTTVLMSVPKGEKIGVDPLIDFYREHFHLAEDVRFIRGKVEDLNRLVEKKADAIFGMNSLDHIDNLSAVPAVLARQLKPDGRLVVLLNVTKSRTLGGIYSALGLYRILDPTHPHHFNSHQHVSRFFSGSFETLRAVNVSHIRAGQTETEEKYERMERKSPLLKRIVFAFLEAIKKQETYLFLMKPKKDG